jgi:hypothetical protein
LITDTNPWLLAVASLVTLAVTARAFAEEPPRRRLGSVLLASLDAGHYTVHRSSGRSGETLHARLVGVRRSREARLFPIQGISTADREVTRAPAPIAPIARVASVAPIAGLAFVAPIARLAPAGRVAPAAPIAPAMPDALAARSVAASLAASAVSAASAAAAARAAAGPRLSAVPATTSCSAWCAQRRAGHERRLQRSADGLSLAVWRRQLAGNCERDARGRGRSRRGRWRGASPDLTAAQRSPPAPKPAHSGLRHRRGSAKARRQRGLEILKLRSDDFGRRG